jgi:hypothetical protein
MMRPQNRTEHQASARALEGSDDRFDQELAGWIAQHGGIWSGTAAELLAVIRARVGVANDLWPHSPRALRGHLESHRQILRSLGVDALVRHGYPGMISLRSCQDEKPAEPLSSAFAINDFGQDNPAAESDLAESLNGNYPDRAKPEGVCPDTEEAPLATLESSKPGTNSELATAAAWLWAAFKKAWMRSIGEM